LGGHREKELRTRRAKLAVKKKSKRKRDTAGSIKWGKRKTGQQETDQHGGWVFWGR